MVAEHKNRVKQSKGDMIFTGFVYNHIDNDWYHHTISFFGSCILIQLMSSKEFS